MDWIRSEPVSPTGQYFNSKALSIVILGVLESEIPLDDSQTVSLLNNVFLPINPRFSSIMAADENGGKKWKRVEVKLENHVRRPVFSSIAAENDDAVLQYLSGIAMEPFPQSQPLWEIHIIKYPTTTAAGSIVFKLHHALGDGFSLMGALLSCLQRADNPALPISFPPVMMSSDTKHGNPLGLKRSLGKALSVVSNTLRDFGWSAAKSTCAPDDLSPIRSGAETPQPISIATTTFPLDSIKEIKSRLQVTINDVITGITFLGTRLYMESRSESSGKSANSTALVLLNTRNLQGYRSVKDMVQPNSETPWGNNFAFLHVPIPKPTEDSSVTNPLRFVRQAHDLIKRKRTSYGFYLIGKVMEMLKKCRGPEVTAQYIHRTMRNSSMVISNLVGPMEPASLANHPVKGIYFVVVGAPLSVGLSIISYAGDLRVAVEAEEGLIDSKEYTRFLDDAFNMMLEAARQSSHSI